MRLFLLRQQIQKIDREIIELLKKRFILSRKIAKEKKKNCLDIKNQKVEDNILRKYSKYADNLSFFIKAIYKEIFKQSRSFQRDKSN